MITDNLTTELIAETTLEDISDSYSGGDHRD